LKVEKVAVGDLTPDASNVRLHSTRNIDAIKNSLATFEQYKPIVVQEKTGRILAGNGTYAAAKALGWTHIECNMVDVDDVTATALAIADNRTGDAEIGSTWDEGGLAALLDSLPEDLRAMTGFAPGEIEALAGNEPDEIVEDTAPGLSEDVRTEPGQMYQLGEHRLMCGDSTDAETVARLMGGEKADMAIADPPYNVGYEYNTGDDKKTDSDYHLFCNSYTDNALSFAPMIAITPGKSNEHNYRSRPDYKEYLTWFKKFGLSRGSFYKAMVTEPILLLGEKPTSKFYPTDCLEYMTEREEGLRDLHTCPKPVKLWAAIISPMTSKGSIVLEMFGGSGTAVIACEQTGRKCRMMELGPKYCDVIVKRYCALKEIDPETVFTSSMASV